MLTTVSCSDHPLPYSYAACIIRCWLIQQAPSRVSFDSKFVSLSSSWFSAPDEFSAPAEFYHWSSALVYSRNWSLSGGWACLVMGPINQSGFNCQIKLEKGHWVASMHWPLSFTLLTPLWMFNLDLHRTYQMCMYHLMILAHLCFNSDGVQHICTFKALIRHGGALFWIRAVEYVLCLWIIFFCILHIFICSHVHIHIFT